MRAPFPPAIALLALHSTTTVRGEFFCSEIWGNTSNGFNNGNAQYRVSARYPSDVDRMNERFNRCHTNCNSTETRFIWFQYSPTSYPFIMDGTCPTPNETATTHEDVYNLVDLDNEIGNGTDFRCGHHRGIGHEAGYYSIVEMHCLDKIGTLNAYANRPIVPTPTAAPSSAPTTLSPTTQAPTVMPTAAPTPHPCTDGTHNCDLSSTQCVITQGNGFQCMCLSGYVFYNSTQCMLTPTTAPSTTPTATPSTAAPSFAPTSFPTMDPCTAGTDACDRQSTTCAAYSFAPFYTCLCNEANNYVPVYNADPWTQRYCVQTPPPTTQPPSTSTSGAASSTSGSGSDSTTIAIVIIVLVVAVVVIGAAVYLRSGPSSPAAANTDGLPAAGFENPMYSFSGEATTSDESAESAGGYMDVQAGGDEEF